MRLPTDWAKSSQQHLYSYAMTSANRSPKDPIREAPLREPGQHLRESLSGLVMETVAPWLTLAVIIILAAIVEWFRWSFSLSPHPIPLTIVAIGVVFLAIRQVRIAQVQAKALKLGLKGERFTGQLLQSELLPIGYQVFHDCCFENFNVDHVAIGPGGIFAVETKTRSKPGGDKRVRYDGEHVTVNGMRPDRDPVRQAQAGADRIQRVFEQFVGRSASVRPVVLFPGWFVEGKSSGAAVWVLNPEAFIGWVKKERLQLHPEDISAFSAGLAQYIRGTLAEVT
jgi:hypothetical protein